MVGWQAGRVGWVAARINRTKLKRNGWTGIDSKPAYPVVLNNNVTNTVTSSRVAAAIAAAAAAASPPAAEATCQYSRKHEPKQTLQQQDAWHKHFPVVGCNEAPLLFK